MVFLQIAVARNDTVSLGWVDVDLAQVALDVGQCQQPLVHDSVPKPRDVGDEEHAEVAIWQFWDVIEVSQALVSPSWVGMMIRMAFQMEQQDVAENIIGVPAVIGLAMFIAAVFFALAK